MDRIRVIETKMREAGQSDAAIAAFLDQVSRLTNDPGGLIPESEIEPVSDLPDYASVRAEASAQAPPVAVIKLNGGLGTGMGLDRAKSLLEVKEGLTFLDLIARQVLYLREQGQTDLPFLLMNSFSTRADTCEFLRRYPGLGDPSDLEFLQSQVPKLDAESGLPVAHPEHPELEWCPPGHGDVYASLSGSGQLDSLIDAGIEFIFVSNADNLGAVPDSAIAAHMEQARIDFLMEVTRRTPSDRKGGHLAQQAGNLILRESAQTPANDQDAFQDIGKHRYFNTNNLWIRLTALKALLDSGQLQLPLIINRKTVDPKDPNSTPVIQLETAMGAAIGCFERSGALTVPRSRFAPVKKTSDLIVLRSDACRLRADSVLELIPERGGNPPDVQLSGHYKSIDHFNDLVSVVPSLQAADRLIVEGPVRFSEPVEIRGTVQVTADGATPVTLPGGVYEDEQVKL